MNHDTIKMIHHHPVENTGAKPKMHHSSDSPYPLVGDSRHKMCSLIEKCCQPIRPTPHLVCGFTASI